MWTGDYLFLLNNLVKRDFQVRYRNMSLGIFWSLLNPLVTTALLTFVFTKISIFSSPKPHYPVFVLCGLVPFNFFTIALSTSTSSLVDNGRIIKRLPVPREIIPISTVLGNCVHLVIQIGLLLVFTVGFGLGVNRYWLWLPLLWALMVLFVCGLALIVSAVNVYIRDTRYVVESANTILFWLVPIFYSIETVPEAFAGLYRFNPVAAMVVALRSILLDGTSPAFSILRNLALVSTVMMAIGVVVFRKMKQGFYDYL
jgi:lipopolysaccharide transport system permease protein